MFKNTKNIKAIQKKWCILDHDSLIAPVGFVLTISFPNLMVLESISSLGFKEFSNHLGGGESSERYLEGGERYSSSP